MVNPSRCLALIPARGGSKRLPGKNVRSFGGKPLIRHTIDTAIEASCFKQIVVSTDSAEIASAASATSGVIVDRRASHLAEDQTKVIDVVLDLIGRSEIASNFDALAMLLPTAPLRRAEDIRSALALLDEKADAVVTVAEFEFPPTMAVTLDQNNVMRPMLEASPLLSGDTRSQDQQRHYRPNGAVLVSWLSSLKKLQSFYTGAVRCHVMGWESSVDIDTEDDFQLAEWLFQKA